MTLAPRLYVTAGFALLLPGASHRAPQAPEALPSFATPGIFTIG